MNDPSYRGGAQVHAVPDDERAFDATGRPLPWGYAYADSNLNRKPPVERGPFGRTTSRRSMSRSKTATPSTKEDLQRQENQRVQDEIFGSFRRQQEQSKSANKPSTTMASRDRDPPGRNIHDPNTVAQAAIAPLAKSKEPDTTSTQTFMEPTPILIHGFLPSHEPPSLHFYETVSRGLILEDYDRSPIPHGFTDPSKSSLNLLSATTARMRTPRTLPPEALRKINKYEGGEHWIRVTLDSPAAAMRACEASPHVIGGCEVHCSLWTGVGPAEDVANPAGSRRSAGTIGRAVGGADRDAAGRREWQSFPSRVHSGGNGPRDRDESYQLDDTRMLTNGDSPSSSSATATGNSNDSPSSSSTATGVSLPQQQQQQQQATSQPPTIQRQSRLRNARLLPLHPASEAFLPTVPWTVRTLGGVPAIGSLITSPSTSGVQAATSSTVQGGSAGMGFIGSAIPRTESGELDWNTAGFWWWLCWLVDWVFGSDLCGLKDD